MSLMKERSLLEEAEWLSAGGRVALDGRSVSFTCRTELVRLTGPFPRAEAKLSALRGADLDKDGDAVGMV